MSTGTGAADGLTPRTRRLFHQTTPSPYMADYLTPFLALLVAGGLAVSEAVQLELIRVLGLLVASTASVIAAYLTYRERKTNRRYRNEMREKVDRKRKAVRGNETGDGVVVVEERRNRGRDADA